MYFKTSTAAVCTRAHSLQTVRDTHIWTIISARMDLQCVNETEALWSEAIVGRTLHHFL